MQPTPEQVAILRDAIVIVIATGLLKLWPTFKRTPKFAKVVTVAVGAILVAGFATGWKLDAAAWQQIGWTVAAALAGADAYLAASSDLSGRTALVRKCLAAVKGKPADDGADQGGC